MLLYFKRITIGIAFDVVMVLIYRFADISVCECVFLPSELGYVFKVNSKQPQNINNTKKEVKQSNVAERNETNRKNDI